MSRHRGFLLAALAFSGLGFHARARAEDAQQNHEKLYGQEARKVAFSSDGKVVAARLLGDAKNLKDAPDLAGVLPEKAYEFGMKNPAAFPAAVPGSTPLNTAACSPPGT